MGAAGIAGAALIGCGSDDEAAAPAATSAASGAATAAPAATEAVVRAGGTWKRGTSSSPNFVRIPLNTAGNNTPINQNGGLFNRLVRVGKTELGAEAGYDRLERMVNQDFDIYPDLATSWEAVDNNMTWNFTLREDAKWHTGRPFTAEDVVFTYEAIQDPGAGGGGSPLNLMSVNIDSVTAVNDKTVQIKLKKPTGYFGTLLSQTNIADRETIGQVEQGVLVGTGAFKFENFDPNRGYDLVRNEAYHGKRPHVDKIEFTIFADTAAAGLAVETGDIHESTVGVGNPEAEARMLKSAKHYGAIGTGQGGRVIRLRADLPPTDDKRVRQGLLMLVDSERITKEFAGSFDVPARLPWQPSSAAFNAELDRPVFDAAEAAKLFDAAGIRGSTIKADILPERLDAPALAQLLQQELAQMDITLQITPREYTEMITLQTTGTFEHMIVGFGNWVKSGDPAVTVLFADAYDGRMNAPSETEVPLRDRPGIREEPEWMDMIDAAKDGTWTDWDAWNKKYLDVAWSNVLFRQYGARFYTNELVFTDGYDAEGFPFVEGVGLRA